MANDDVFWYRVEGDAGSSLWIWRLRVVKTTPCGVWLEQLVGHHRFVLRDARKRYACPTVAEAIDSFVARKRRQLKILTAQVDRVTAMLDAATNYRQELIERGRTPPPFSELLRWSL